LRESSSCDVCPNCANIAHEGQSVLRGSGSCSCDVRTKFARKDPPFLCESCSCNVRSSAIAHEEHSSLRGSGSSNVCVTYVAHEDQSVLRESSSCDVCPNCANIAHEGQSVLRGSGSCSCDVRTKFARKDPSFLCESCSCNVRSSAIAHENPSSSLSWNHYAIPSGSASHNLQPNDDPYLWVGQGLYSFCHKAMDAIGTICSKTWTWLTCMLALLVIFTFQLSSAVCSTSNGYSCGRVASTWARVLMIAALFCHAVPANAAMRQHRVTTDTSICQGSHWFDLTYPTGKFFVVS
jgi:hypothetical protein